MSVSLRTAVERLRDATDDELDALRVDLAYERAQAVYDRDHALALVAVYDALLAGPFSLSAASGGEPE